MPSNRSRRTKLQCHPLTPQRWDDFAALFGPRGACAGCWCMFWRLPRSQFNQQKGDANRDALHALVLAGATPGILGYLNDEPIGWCAIAPREDYSALQRSRILKPIDDQNVWSVSCLFVRKDSRKKGVSVALLRNAIDFVRKRGGGIVEGYPVEPAQDVMPDPFVWTGLASAYLQAGFEECARRSPTRPIMRYVIAKGMRGRSK